MNRKGLKIANEILLMIPCPIPIAISLQIPLFPTNPIHLVTFPLKVRSQSLHPFFMPPWPSVTTIPAPPLSLPFTKSPHFTFMPQFDHNHSINSTHILNSIPDLLFFSSPPTCPSTPPSHPLIHPQLPLFASQSADAKSLRDPSKIKAIRLQVGRAFDSCSLLQSSSYFQVCSFINSNKQCYYHWGLYFTFYPAFLHIYK